MPKHIIWATLTGGQRVKFAESDTREHAEVVLAALNQFSLKPFQEEEAANSSVDSFKLETIEVVWKTDQSRGKS